MIGDLRAFDARICEKIAAAEALTANNTDLTLTIAANYGGRWDILQAIDKIHKLKQGRAFPSENVSKTAPDGEFTISENDIAQHLSMSYAPEPDLFIRTGGEARISNFLLWQLAYTEFYFSQELWPDFSRLSLQKAIESYQRRERRFGRTSEQLIEAKAAVAPTPDAA